MVNWGGGKDAHFQEWVKGAHQNEEEQKLFWLIDKSEWKCFGCGYIACDKPLFKFFTINMVIQHNN